MTNFTKPILAGGLLAGTLDISYALIRAALLGGVPARVLKSVASGVFGRPAFNGGWEMAALGLLLHFVVATGATTVFYVVSRWIPIMRRRPALFGPLFGVCVYAVMNRVVVPLSAAPFRINFELSGLLVHMFLVGLPIAVAVGKLSPEAAASADQA